MLRRKSEISAAEAADSQCIVSININSSQQQVANYIKHLKLGKHQYDDVSKQFTNEHIDGRMFLYLEKGDLNTLGVIQLSRRNALYDHIKSLRESSLRKTSLRKRSLSENKLIFRPRNISKGILPYASIAKKINNDITKPPASILSSVPFPLNGIAPAARNSKSGSFSISSQFADLLSSLPTMSVSLDLNNTQKLEKKFISSPGQGIKTEYCPYMTMKSGADCIKFIAVYRGANDKKWFHKKQVWVLMDVKGITTFNEIALQWSVDNKQTKNVKFCVIDCATQIFDSSLFICKLRTGWQIGGTKFPYNPIVVCTYNLKKNELISMLPMDAIGYVNHIDERGLIWVSSEFTVKALEERNEDSDSGRTGKVSEISFEDNRDNQFSDTFSSYLVHDWTDYKFDCDVSERVIVCMKLSTKTNQKRNEQNQRPVFIQVWNLRNDPNLYAEKGSNYAAMPVANNLQNQFPGLIPNVTMPYTNQFSAAVPDYFGVSNLSLQAQMMMPMQTSMSPLVLQQQQMPMQYFMDPALMYNPINIPMSLQQNAMTMHPNGVMMDPSATAINYNDYTLAKVTPFTPIVPEVLNTDIVQSCAEEQKEEQKEEKKEDKKLN